MILIYFKWILKKVFKRFWMKFIEVCLGVILTKYPPCSVNLAQGMICPFLSIMNRAGETALMDA